MYWAQNRIEVDGKDGVLIAYFHINPTTKEVEIHTKICQDEDEFIPYYNRIKSL